MKIIDTKWGTVAQWGYNCAEYLRDLRKLNGGFTEHHPDWENMCARSDTLRGKILGIVEELDALVKDNDGVVWITPVVEKYDSLIKKLEAFEDELENLCVKEYPDGSRIHHYSYCV